MIDEKKLIEIYEEEITYQKENDYPSLEIKGLEYALSLLKRQPKVGKSNE